MPRPNAEVLAGRLGRSGDSVYGALTVRATPDKRQNWRWTVVDGSSGKALAISVGRGQPSYSAAKAIFERVVGAERAGAMSLTIQKLRQELAAARTEALEARAGQRTRDWVLILVICLLGGLVAGMIAGMIRL